MRLVVSTQQKPLSAEDRAYLVQLAALNAALEAARAGQPKIAQRAQAMDQILEHYFSSLGGQQLS